MGSTPGSFTDHHTDYLVDSKRIFLKTNNEMVILSSKTDMNFTSFLWTMSRNHCLSIVITPLRPFSIVLSHSSMNVHQLEAIPSHSSVMREVAT